MFWGRTTSRGSCKYAANHGMLQSSCVVFWHWEWPEFGYVRITVMKFAPWAHGKILWRFSMKDNWGEIPRPPITFKRVWVNEQVTTHSNEHFLPNMPVTHFWKICDHIWTDNNMPVYRHAMVINSLERSISNSRGSKRWQNDLFSVDFQAKASIKTKNFGKRSA